MSALPPKADIEGQTRDCAGFILETDIAVKGRPSGRRDECFQIVCRELVRRIESDISRGIRHLSGAILSSELEMG